MTKVELVFNKQLERFYEELFKSSLNSISINLLQTLLADKISAHTDKCMQDVFKIALPLD